MELKICQFYQIESSIAQGYERIHGKFSFVVKVLRLYRTTPTPKVAVDGDITFGLIDWSPMNGVRQDPWFALHCIAGGYDKYWQIQMKVPAEDASGMNWSPNFIDGEGTWYVPDLFRRQDHFLHLVYGGGAVLLEDYHPPDYGVSV